MKRVFQTILVFAILAAMAVAAVWLEVGNETVISGNPVVVDGDSLEINRERLRLWGIDAPEFNQMCEREGARWKCGRESRLALRRLVRSGTVACRAIDIDKYDRWLVECEVDGRSINEAMVGQGWALAYGGYYDVEESARKLEIGIWSGGFERPKQWRDAQRGDLAAGPVSSFARTAWARLKRLAKWASGL
ncbi:MAG: thermonuclease family protein [Rhizobiaceae bacterium]